MTDQEFDDLLSRANEELRTKQERLNTDYRIGDLPRWCFDQATEKLQFLDLAGNVVVEADVIDIGSYSPTSNTWKWAWGNESVLPALREKAAPLKELEEITGFDLFGMDQPFEVDESMAWELTALAVLHLQACGCYRAPASNGPFTFLAIMAAKKILR